MARRKYSNAKLEEVARLREKGRSYGEIARRLGMSDGAVYYHCLKAGADSPEVMGRAPVDRGPMTVRRGAHFVRRYTAEEDALLIQMEGAGASLAEMARRLGRKHNSVHGRLMTLARIDARAEFAEGGFA